jgi:hypothetical protein
MADAAKKRRRHLRWLAALASTRRRYVPRPTPVLPPPIALAARSPSEPGREARGHATGKQAARLLLALLPPRALPSGATRPHPTRTPWRGPPPSQPRAAPVRFGPGARLPPPRRTPTDEATMARTTPSVWETAREISRAARPRIYPSPPLRPPHHTNRARILLWLWKCRGARR